MFTSFILTQLDYIYFVYGLGFVLLAAAGLSLSRREAASGLPWGALGVFGVIMAVFQWLEMVSLSLPMREFWAASLVMQSLPAAAFACLVEIARAAGGQGRRLSRWVYPPLFALALAGLLAGSDGLIAAGRYVFCLIGGLGAAWAIGRAARRAPAGRGSLRVIAWTLGLYSLSFGLIAPRAGFFPASQVNMSAFLALTGAPIQAVRCLLGLGLAAAVCRHSLALVDTDSLEAVAPGALGRERRMLIELAVLLLLGWGVTEWTECVTTRGDRRHLLNWVSAVAASLDPEACRGLVGEPGEESGPAFRRLQAHLARVTGEDEELWRLYTLRPKGAGVVYTALAGLELDPADARTPSTPGAPYERGAELREVFESGKSLLLGPYATPWGEVVSGFAPIRDPQSLKPIGALGLDLDGAAWGRRVCAHRLAPICVTLVTCVLLVGFAVARQKLHRFAGQLLDSERRYRGMFEDNSAVMLIYEPVARVILDANPAACAYYGMTRRELGELKIDVISLMPGKEMAALFKHVLRGEQRVYASRHRLASGEVRDVEVNCMPLQWDGRTCLYAIIIDVTERNLAQRLLDEQYRYLQTIIEAMPNPLYTKDLNRRITSCNGALLRFIGCTREEVIGKTVYDMMPREIAARYDAMDARLLEESGIQLYEGEMDHRDGTRLNVIFHKATFTQADGAVGGMVGIITDVTELKRARQEVEQVNRNLKAINTELERAIERANQLALEAEVANRAKSEFLANMSHEIRTPMNGIIGMTGLLLDSPLEPEQREFAETIRGSAEALLTIVNDILDFSKVESGQMELESIDFDLRSTLEDLGDLLAIKAQEKGLEYVCSISPETPSRLTGDPGRLRQVLTNLIGNAIKFTQRGEVVVAVDLVREEGREVTLRFEVRDTGIGVPAGRLDRLFRPFVQADASTTRRFGGAGLGLAISRRLVERMGGKIGLHSVEGRGSTCWFTARLAVQQARDPETEGSDQSARVLLQGQRVLIVDDNPASRRVLMGQLRAWQCRCEEADGAERALDLLQDAAAQGDPFRLAILDMQLAGMDGAELGAAIKRQPALAGAQLVMMSSAGRRGDAARLEKLGFAAYLAKPVKKSHLFKCLELALNAGSAAPAESRAIITRHTVNEARRRKVRILLAEDNSVNQRVALRILDRLGYRADAVANGLEAVDAFMKIPYDLILMDIQMPEMDGLDATRAIRRAEEGSGRRIPILAMTAHALKGDREWCLDAGMDDYISKPFQPQRLVEAIERLLEQSAAGDDALIPDAEAAPADDDGAVFDRKSLAERLDDNEALLGEVVKLFLDDARRHLERLAQAIAAGDLHQAGRIAHSIKGSSANIGAHAFREAALKVERAAQDGVLDPAHPSAAALRHEFDRFIACLKGGQN